MRTPVLPEYEQERLKALRRFDILDTPPDGAFDRITALAARLFKVPISIVSLVDHDRIWFKSQQGLDVQEVNRDLGLCASAILSDDVYFITNAIEDPRSLANPLVAGCMGFRFYAAAPLRTHDAYNLGTLCVIDIKPRDISESEKLLLQELAEIVMDQMELRLNARRQAAEEERRRSEERLSNLRSLLESIQIINSQLDLDAVLRSIVEEGAQLIGGEPGAVGLIEDEHVVFRHIWLDDHWDDLTLKFKIGEGMAGKAALGQSVIVNQVQEPLEVAFPDVLKKYKVHGFMDVPIISRKGEVVGVLDVRRKRNVPAFSDTDRQLLETLANKAAVAIENARLYGELERLYRKEQEVLKQLQYLDQLKTNFMLVTSHEMRTPLTVLTGYTEMLSEGLLGELEPIQKKALDSCHRMVERLNINFNKILEMVKLSEGRLPLNVREVDISGILSQGLLELEPFIERRNLSVVKELPALCFAVVDPEKIHLVFLNLFQNAIKYTPDGGTITVRLELAVDGYQVAITDTGVGIHPSELNQIFELFYTTDDLSTHQSGTFEFLTHGTGLGLAIAKKHIEAHGGRIWAESNGPGQGSCFNVWLPGLPKN